MTQAQPKKSYECGSTWTAVARNKILFFISYCIYMGAGKIIEKRDIYANGVKLH